MSDTLVFQRPRKVGAKFTGDNIAPDEHITPTLNFDYEGKRDHAAGVDVEDHQRKVHEEYSRLEEVSGDRKSFSKRSFATFLSVFLKTIIHLLSDTAQNRHDWVC